MWIYEKKLQYPVKIKNPNPRLATAILSALGGPDGEMGAATRYLNQRYTMPDGRVIGVLTDVGSEELGHMEMVASIIYQLTRNLTPEEIKAVFAKEKTVDTGIKHGTVSLILRGVQYEITTYRTDGEYLDARHPESVSFSRSIEDDLSRRDFTVNAMCYNLNLGVTDLHGGREDLRRGVIRAVGDP
jgi:spore coat protein JC